MGEKEEENLTATTSIKCFAIWQKSLQNRWWRLTPTQWHLSAANNQFRLDNEQLSAFIKTMSDLHGVNISKVKLPLFIWEAPTKMALSSFIHTLLSLGALATSTRPHNLCVPNVKTDLTDSLLLIHDMLTSSEPLVFRSPSSLESFTSERCVTIGITSSLGLSLF